MTAEDDGFAADVGRAVEALRGRTVLALTGAGISTDSGIPDYRGKGAPVRTPMTVGRFLAQTDEDRRRYWAGGQLGYRAFSATQPNAGHLALATLEHNGVVNGVVTQNVDGLHLQAGSQRVVELHGTGRRIVCVRCGQVYDRRDLSARIERDNPWLVDVQDVELGPDGDVIPTRTHDLVVPDCTNCGGILRPDVVMFGEFIPPARFKSAESLLRAANALLVVGSSLVVNSGMRFVERARKRRLPIVIVNQGETRGDSRATVKVTGGATPALTRIAAELLTGTAS